MTVSNDFSVADVLAWARTKPAGEPYQFVNAGVCALGQYARAHGWSEAQARCGSYEVYVSDDLRWAANPCGPVGTSKTLWGGTFGQFVKRLEKLCPETPVTKSDWLSIDTYLSDIEQVDA